MPPISALRHVPALVCWGALCVSHVPDLVCLEATCAAVRTHPHTLQRSYTTSPNVAHHWGSPLRRALALRDAGGTGEADVGCGGRDSAPGCRQGGRR
eukprot:2145023-Prymnesium_polylepis.1